MINAHLGPSLGGRHELSPAEKNTSAYTRLEMYVTGMKQATAEGGGKTPCPVRRYLHVTSGDLDIEYFENFSAEPDLSEILDAA